MNDRIHVSLVSDSNYLDFVLITMTSMLINLSKERELTLHFLYPEGGITEEDLKRFESLQYFHPFEFHPISLDTKKFAEDYGRSRAILWRLELPNLLPELDRLIYLDCDMVLLDDISKLYDIDLEGHLLGGCIDRAGQKAYPEIAVSPAEYINSGMMLWDLKAIREAGLPEAWRKVYKEHPQWFHYPDQCLINYIAKGRIKKLPLRWNLINYVYRRLPFEGTYTIEETKEALSYPGIAHFTGHHKPWLFWKTTHHAFAKAFWHYADLAPISPWKKLKFRLKQLVTGRLKSPVDKVPWNKSILPKKWR